jgi:hypothetical protein
MASRPSTNRPYPWPAGTAARRSMHRRASTPGLSGGDPSEGEVALVERLVARAPARCALQRTDGVPKAVRQEEDAAQGPPVERSARGGAHPRGRPQVASGDVEFAQRGGGASRVLMEDVREDPERERRPGKLEGLLEVSALEVGQVKLPQEHRVRRLVDARSRRETSLRPDPPSPRGGGRQRAAQILLGRHRARRSDRCGGGAGGQNGRAGGGAGGRGRRGAHPLHGAFARGGDARCDGPGSFASTSPRSSAASSAARPRPDGRKRAGAAGPRRRAGERRPDRASRRRVREPSTAGLSPVPRAPP